MTSTKRKALLGVIVGAFAVAAAVPMIVSGTASAQTNSRLCGRVFKSPRTAEVTVRIFEVRKSDSIVCKEAALLHRAGGDQLTARQSPFLRTFKDTSFDDWPSAAFKMHECEGWRNRPMNDGGLGDKDINFIGDNFPQPHDHFDICTNMNRSDTIFDMNEYWLYAHPTSENASFQRD